MQGVAHCNNWHSVTFGVNSYHVLCYSGCYIIFGTVSPLELCHIQKFLHLEQCHVTSISGYYDSSNTTPHLTQVSYLILCYIRYYVTMDNILHFVT